MRTLLLECGLQSAASVSIEGVLETQALGSTPDLLNLNPHFRKVPR